ncbi:MAG: hypothetical protein V4475_16285 [Pseudomonadota bacterium]
MNIRELTLKAAAGLTLVAAAHACPAAAQVTAIPAGEVTTELSCEDAAKGYAEVQGGTATPDRIIVVLNALNICGVQAYNRAQEANGSPTRAVATATVSEEQGRQKVAFGLVTLDRNDVEAVKQICSAGAKVVGGTFADPLLTPVMTVAGNYSCKSYVDAAVASNKLLLFAPTLVPSVTLTADVLRRAGVSEQDIRHGMAAIAAVTDAATTAATQGTRAAVSVTTLGIVKIDKKLRCAKIFGKRVCR